MGRIGYVLSSQHTTVKIVKALINVSFLLIMMNGKRNVEREW